MFSSLIVCFHAWAEKWEHPLGELALIHLRETGAKAEKASLNAVVSTVSKSLALCVLRFTLLWFSNTFTLCVHNDRAVNDGKSLRITIAGNAIMLKPTSNQEKKIRVEPRIKAKCYQVSLWFFSLWTRPCLLLSTIEPFVGCLDGSIKMVGFKIKFESCFCGDGANV